MRWVGKATVVLLLFLNVCLLLTHGKSVLRNKDLHGTRKLLSITDDAGGSSSQEASSLISGLANDIILDQNACNCAPTQDCILNSQNETICKCPSDQKEFKVDGVKTCVACNCAPTQECILNSQNEPICKCPSDQKEFTVDGVKTCVECSCAETQECFVNQQKNTDCRCTSGKTEFIVEGVKTCFECSCVETYECFVNHQKQPDCRCPSGKIEVIVGGVETNTSICVACNCPPTQECFLNEKNQPDCRCRPDETEFLVNNVKTCFSCNCDKSQECFLNKQNEPACRCPSGQQEFTVDNVKKCFKCNCHQTQECFLNSNGNADCRCSDGKIEKTDDTGVKYCVEDEQTDPCERNPCQNEGTCENVGDTDYKCYCLDGVSGKNCEKIDWCEKNKAICGEASCKYDKNLKSGVCFCDKGFYFDATHPKCEELDKCLLQRIKGKCRGKHETCDSKGKCKCEENYAYNQERTACEPDFCGEKSKKSSPCGSNMDCSIKDETVSCSCKKGFRQFGRQCVKVNTCVPGVSQCPQKCTNSVCSCFTGFQWNTDTKTCERKETTSECTTLECHPGSCVVEGNTPKCVCPQISHVFLNNTCIDKCAAGSITANECPSEVGCLSDDVHGYKCNCTGKYGFAEDDIHCIAKQMCSEGDGNEICSNKNQLCEDDFASPEGYKCNCKYGYEKVKSSGECRHKCERAGCDKKQALCIITDQNKAECICPPLLVKDSDGKCSQLAKYSYLGDFSVPKSNYQLITTKNSGRMKRDTSEDINYSKLLKDFETSMKNIFTTYEDASILRCIDKDDELSCSMEIKLKEDPKEKINIVSTPSVCLSLDESHCLIQPDFVIKKRSDEVFHKTDPCDKIVNGKMCGNETRCKAFNPRGFKCECKQGYFRRNYYVPAPDVVIEVCEDVNECLNQNICPNTTTCSNFQGDYTCKCIDGHHLEEGKSVKVDGCKAVCDPNPCNHGECTVTGTDGFSCSCDDFYTGPYCNQTNDVIKGKLNNLKQAGTKTSAIVGGVLGAFLVMAIIICIILFRKLRKQKSIDETEEYVLQRKRGLVSEMRKLGRRQPENDDVELRDNERRPNRENEDQRYNAQFRINPIDSMSIPRPQLSRSAGKGSTDGEDAPDRRESGDYRRGYSGDDRMLPKPHSSRHTSEEVRRSSQRDDDRQERSRRPLSRSSDPLDNEKVGVSRMQYRNRGYEED